MTTSSPFHPLPRLIVVPTSLFRCQLASFYLELRGLAQDDPEDYAGWEGLEEALDGEDGGGGGETDAGSGSDNGKNAKKHGKKR